jgi:hypothetical protein
MFAPGIGTAIGAGIGGLAGLFGGGGPKSGDISGALDLKAKQQLINRSANLMSNENIFQRFQGLEQQQGGFLNQLMADAGLSGQSQARGIQGGLARAGLGSTGLGAVLGQGAMQGANFQAQNLRAKMRQDLYSQAIGLQSQLSQNQMAPVLGAQGVAPGPSAMQRIGAGMSAGGQWGNMFDRPSDSTTDANAQTLGNLASFTGWI